MLLSRTVELLLGEWEGLISNLETLDKKTPLARSGKENSELAQLGGIEGDDEALRAGKEVDQGSEQGNWETQRNGEARDVSKHDELNSSSSSQKTVACSVCSVSVAPVHLERHQQHCASLQKSFTAPPPSKPLSSRPQLQKLVYALLKDSDLRKKCKEAGLNSKGDRNTLIKRHKRFSLLYNVEREAERPRPNAVLALQVESYQSISFIQSFASRPGGKRGARGVGREAGDTLPPPV